MKIICHFCGKKLRVPQALKGRKGRCPACGTIINLEENVQRIPSAAQQITPEQIDEAMAAIDSHPIVPVLKKYRPQFENYSNNLYQLYDLIRRGVIHKRTFQSKKMDLKRETFTECVTAINKMSDFSLTPLDKIVLWQHVYEFFPYYYHGQSKDVYFNLYPRYDMANIIGMAYVTRPLRNRKLSYALIGYKVELIDQRHTIDSLIRKIQIKSQYQEFARRTYQVVQENEMLLQAVKGRFKDDIEQVYENFGFGFNWISLHVDEAGEVETHLE